MSVPLFEKFDSHAHLRNVLRWAAQDKGEWAGIPMPLGGERLVLEKSYPFAELGQPPKHEETQADRDYAGYKVRNSFWSAHKSSWIVVMERPDGGIEWGLQPGIHHFAFDIHTLGCCDAWGVEQEGNAVKLLGSLVKHRAFKQYMLTGMFLESSKRSGLTYIFRRLKPTVVLSPRGRKDMPDEPRILTTLCLHPIGYYESSWAGSMCPTDDVIAHLMLMRGDEALYWKRAEHHAPHLPSAGL